MVPAWYYDPDGDDNPAIPKRSKSGERKRRPSIQIFPGEDPNDEINKHLKKFESIGLTKAVTQKLDEHADQRTVPKY